MGLIVDTGVFVRIERGGLSLDPGRLGGPGNVSICAITLSELWVGAYRANTEGRRARRLAFIDHFARALERLPFTANTAIFHAQLAADMQSRGIVIGAHDLIIAATAVECGHAVLTTNRRDFERVPGLQVVDFLPEPGSP